jgi:hypothetical protein
MSRVRGRAGRSRQTSSPTALGILFPVLLVILVSTLGATEPAGAKTPGIEKPGPPTSIEAVGINTGIAVSWTAPSSDGGSPITGYTVRAKRPRSSGTCTSSGATTCTVTGLVNGDTYQIEVWALNAKGKGHVSAKVNGTPIPGSWQAEETYAVTPAAFSAISCASTADCTAVESDHIVATTNGGTNWATENVPVGSGPINGVSCPSTMTCIAVGSTPEEVGSAVVIATTNGGSSWTVQNLPPGLASLSGVSCPVKTTCSAVGSTTAGQATVVTTTNGGANWTLENLPADLQSLDGISCPSTTTCVAGGTIPPGGSCAPFPSCPSIPFTMVTTNKGVTWTTASESVGPDQGGSFLGVSCPTASECVAVGGAGLIRDDEGISEGILLSGTCTLVLGCGGLNYVTSTTEFEGVSCRSASACMAVGGGQVATAGPTGWTTQTAPIEEVDGVSCSSTSECMAVGGLAVEGPGAVVDTADGGASWATVFALPYGVDGLAAVSCPTTSVCTAAGSTEDADGQIPPGQDAGPGAVVHSTNGGASWMTQSFPAGVGNISAVSCASTSVCEVLGETPTQSAPVVVGTTNGGSTWQSQSVPSGLDGVSGLSCPTTSVCTAIGDRSGNPAIFDTTDGGSTWNYETAPGALSFLSSIACSSATVCTAVGERTANRAAIVATSDGGTKWGTEKAPRGLFQLSSIACATVTACSAAGIAGTVNGPAALVATSDGGATWTSEKVPSGVDWLSGISCASPAACTAVGMATVNGPGVIIGTGGGGSTWAAEVTPQESDFIGASCPAVGACTGVGDSSASGAVIVGQA